MWKEWPVTTFMQPGSGLILTYEGFVVIHGKFKTQTLQRHQRILGYKMSVHNCAVQPNAFDL